MNNVRCNLKEDLWENLVEKDHFIFKTYRPVDQF